MKDFETYYIPQQMPPAASKSFFLTIAEMNYGDEFLVIGDISHSWSEATNKKKLNRYLGITDSFVRGFDTEEEAMKYMNTHGKLEVA